MTINDYLKIDTFIDTPYALEFEGYWYYSNGKTDVLLDKETKKSIPYELNPALPLSVNLNHTIRSIKAEYGNYTFQIWIKDRPIYLEQIEPMQTPENMYNVGWGRFPIFVTTAQNEPLYKMNDKHTRFQMVERDYDNDSFKLKQITLALA